VRAALLRVDGVSKRFGGFTALQDISVDIRAGERFGLIGPNGSGKTTLINCISGVLASDGGSIEFDGQDVTRLPAYRRTRRGIARSFQVPRPFRTMSVLENLLVAIDFGVEGHGLSDEKATAEVMAILDKIGLADKARASSGQLSQVELRKMELARAMAARPKLLISDEAMAGLAGAEVDEVLDVLLKLNAEGITVIMIEHIMQAVMRFSERVMCLDAGRIVCEGTPAQVMDDKRVQEAYLGA
jgi:branched-chain amino acid transport system ATP-binding protein